MVKSIFILITIAFITYLIEFPIMAMGLYKKVELKYINKIVLSINFLTNIVLNGVAIPIVNYFFYDGINYIFIIIFEIFIIPIEYFLYKIAFKVYKSDKSFNKKILQRTVVANCCSFGFGILLQLLQNM